MMKRALIALLTLALCLNLCACAPKPDPAAAEEISGSSQPAEKPEEPAAPPVSPEKPLPEEESGKLPPSEENPSDWAPSEPELSRPSEQTAEPEVSEPMEPSETEVLYYRIEGRTPPDGVELPEIPAWDALPKEDKKDYVHRDLGFQVVDSAGEPLPGFRLTLLGNNTETDYIAGYKTQDSTGLDGSGGFAKVPITDLRLQVQGPDRTVEYTWSGAEVDVLPESSRLVWRYDTLDSLCREVPVLDLQFTPAGEEEPHRTDLQIWCENAPEEISWQLGTPEDPVWLSTDKNGRLRLPLTLLNPDAMKGLGFHYRAEYRVKLPEGGGYAYKAEGTLTGDGRVLTAEIPLKLDD